MSENKKTSNLIQYELENDIYLLEMLKGGLVNYSALSKMLLPKIKKLNSKATIESVSIAIKRYIQRENQLISKSYEIKKIISNSQISTRNDLIHLTFNKTNEVLDEIIIVSKKIGWNREEVLFINQGFGEITLILDRKNKDYFNNIKKEKISEKSNLTLISIKESFDDSLEKSIDVAGIYMHFINLLSRKGINIVELVSTYSQLSIIIHNKDLLDCYSTLDENIKYFRIR